jgi:ABC-type molybdate transport system substrate-binding protein
MHRHFRSIPLIAAVFALASVTPGAAAEIKVLDANALTIAMKEIAADFTKETGNQVTFVGVSPGQVEQRIKAGEVYDLVITATESAAAFEQEGRWRAGTRHPLARVGIGIAVRDGVKVDLSTVESTRQALLDAKSITFSDSTTGGLSGINAQKVLANLGLTDAVKPKTKLASGNLADGQALIAKGEIDIGRRRPRWRWSNTGSVQPRGRSGTKPGSRSSGSEARFHDSDLAVRAVRSGKRVASRARPSYAPSAPRTRSGVNGSSRSRTPVSVAIALPIAQATSGTPSSPAPVGGLSVEITLTSIFGTSDIRATW